MWIIETLDLNGVWIFSHTCKTPHGARASMRALTRKGIRSRAVRG